METKVKAYRSQSLGYGTQFGIASFLRCWFISDHCRYECLHQVIPLVDQHLSRYLWEGVGTILPNFNTSKVKFKKVNVNTFFSPFFSGTVGLSISCKTSNRKLLGIIFTQSYPRKETAKEGVDVSHIETFSFIQQDQVHVLKKQKTKIKYEQFKAPCF